MKRSVFAALTTVLLLAPHTFASAATHVGSASAINLYSLGSADSFSSLAATPNGWVFAGTISSDSASTSWNLPVALGGDDLLVAATDANGKPLWAKRLGTSGDDAGLLVAADKNAVWTVGVTSTAITNPTPTPTESAPLDPDQVGNVADNEGSTGANQLIIAQLGFDGEIRAQSAIDSPDASILAPTKIVLTTTGAIIVGTAAAPESGDTRGFIATVDAQLQTNFAFIGAKSTQITDAEVTARGLQIVGSSSEILAGKKVLGLRDAFTATWLNNSLVNAIRSGSAGVDRTWTSFISTKDGYLLIGTSEAKGKIETVLTSLTRAGKVLFSNRYPLSDDQLVLSSNRVALTTKTASPLFPGWKPAGTDLLILTLDRTGKTSAVTVIGGSGSEELSGFAQSGSSMGILGRTSGPLPKATGAGSVLLARIAR